MNMKKLLLFALLVSAFVRFDAKADEGMWIPLYIEKMILKDMQKLGLELTADQIFSLEQPSVSDAIVILAVAVLAKSCLTRAFYSQTTTADMAPYNPSAQLKTTS